MRDTIKFLLAPAVLIGAMAFAATGYASTTHKNNQKVVPAAQPAQTNQVAYEPDGTPIATGAPRRLSPLASGSHHLRMASQSGRNSLRHKSASRAR